MSRPHHIRGYAIALALFLLILAAAVVVDVIFLQRAPQRVPGQFTGGGIDNWISRGRTIVYVAIIQFAVPIPLAIRWNWSALNGVLGARSDAQTHSIQYWDRDEHRARYTDYMTTAMRLLATSISALGTTAAIIILHAALATDPAEATPGWLLPVVVVAFFAALAASLTPIHQIYAQSRRATD